MNSTRFLLIFAQKVRLSQSFLSKFLMDSSFLWLILGLGPQNTTAITPVIPSKVLLEIFQGFPLGNPVDFPIIFFCNVIQDLLKDSEEIRRAFEGIYHVFYKYQ